MDPNLSAQSSTTRQGEMSDAASMHSSVTQVPSRVPSEDFQRSKPEADPGQPPATPETLVQGQANRMSHHDMPMIEDQHHEPDEEQYRRFSSPRKLLIVSILCFWSALAPISSTAILVAVPNIAKEFGTTGDIINASNALYLAFMGIAATFWGPLSQVWGRRPIFIVSGVLFFIFSLATALSPNLQAYFVFRVFAAFQGTSFLVVGSSAIGDIFEPRSRASAIGWILGGSMVGPAIGPFLGGVIVTFRPWRTIFWLVTAMAGFATVMIIIFFPETIPAKSNGDLAGQKFTRKTKMLWTKVSPLRVAVLIFSYPNLLLNGIASGSLIWSQYALLTPIRYVLNPRFNLSSPIMSGLFYLAPGAGYLVGVFVGGRWADHIVRKYIKRRNGQRIPEDRLRAALPYLCIACPGSIAVYGWTLDQNKGGIPVPVIAMFVQCVAQMFCFPSINTYCLDVMHDKGRSAEVVAGNYLFRYSFAALGTGVVLPAIDGIGVGWFNTITALFLILSGLSIWLTAAKGPSWRDAIDAKHEAKIARQKGVE